jgi:hypothetical protein
MSKKKSPLERLRGVQRILSPNPASLPRPWFPSDDVVHYDRGWLKEENDRRSAQGLPPLQERKRKAIDRERLRHIQMIGSPMMAADINPDYELVEACPETRQAVRTPARRALAALFPSGIPNVATLSHKRLAEQVNAWLLRTEGRLRSIDESTVRRAAGRRR